MRIPLLDDPMEEMTPDEEELGRLALEILEPAEPEAPPTPSTKAIRSPGTAPPLD